MIQLPTRFRPTALAAALALAGAIPTHAVAQDGIPPAAAAQTYTVPAGPLAGALNRFAQQAGLVLSFDPALARGKTTAGLDGSYDADSGLTALLAGSGLRAVRTGEGAYSLEPVPVGAMTLPALKIEAEVAPAATTEGTGLYTTGSVNTATRLPLSLRETPQTVTVVTRQKMDDFALTSVDEVLKSTSGVYSYNRGTNGPNYYSRGFELQSQYDGLENPAGIGHGSRNPSPDSAFLDRVEVLQGASGLLSGAGQPGGTVNLVRKRPTEDLQAHVEVQVGSWNRRRAVSDVSGPLSESGKVRARAVAVWDASDSFVDYVYDDKMGFYGVIDADVVGDITLSASIQYQKNDGRLDNGLPRAADGSDLGLGRSTYLGTVHARSEREYTLYSLRAEKALPSEWNLRAAYTRGETRLNSRNGHFLGGGPLNSETGDGLRISQHHILDKDISFDTLDLHAGGLVKILGRQHDFVIGASSTHSSSESFNSGNFPTEINIYDFDPASPPISPISDSPFFFDERIRQTGLYAVARLNAADSLTVILGSRASWYEFEDAGVRTQDENAVVSPYGGIVFDIGKQVSVYASYSDIFDVTPS